MWDKRAEYVENHDGDSCRMMLDQGFFDRKIIDVRLLGVWAPELDEVGGPECQEFVADWFQTRERLVSPWPFIVTTVRMKVADREQKTFDRYVATVTSRDVADSLNLAVMQFVRERGYGGGTGA